MSQSPEIDADFILQHSGFIRSLARGLLRDESQVDDVVQETLIKALEKGPDNRGALTAWLRTVTRNIAYKTYRSNARRRAREEDSAQAEGQESTVDIVARGEALESLTASVMDLPESAREVVFLRYYEGLSHGEIGQRLGVAAGAVRMRLHRAQKLLQERLDRQSGGDRGAWMAGLAGLAGVPLRDLGRRAETVAGLESTGFGAAAIAAAALVCVGAGAAFWLSTRPASGDFSETAVVTDVSRAADASGRGTIPELAGTDGALDSDRRAEALVPGSALPTEPEKTAAAAPTLDLEFPAGDVSGTVVDRGGRPVKNARVFAAYGPEPMLFRTRTDGRGRFGIDVPNEILQDALDRKYTVLLGATAEGSAPTQVFGWPKEAVDDGLPGNHALLRLRGPGGILSGRVVGPDGRPIVNAAIQLGERNRLGIGFLGQQSAIVPNPLDPQLAAYVDRTNVPLFQGHRSMRGTLGPQTLSANGSRARLLPATYRNSGQDGSFRFGGVELGRRFVRISAKGFAPWNGYVTVAAGASPTKTFPLEPATVLRGAVSRADGLPVRPTLVHAIFQDPPTASTVLTGPDGAYEIPDLRGGPVRIFAEERTPKRPGAPVPVASATLELGTGEVRTLHLELKESETAKVRVVQRVDGTLVPLDDCTIELRATDNPLHLLGNYPLDGDGYAEVPLETKRPSQWIVGRPIEIFKSATGVIKDHAQDRRVTPLLSMPPPSLEEARQGLVIELDVAHSSTTSVLMRPRLRPLRGADKSASQGLTPSFSHLDGFALFQPERSFTYVGWNSGRAGELEFHGVPTGDYRILYPHHGLGWISRFTVHVGATGGEVPVHLGEVALPELGTLKLRPLRASEGHQEGPEPSTWCDLDIRQVLEGTGGKTLELAVCCGRVEVPCEFPIAPGRYVVRSPSHPEADPQWVVIRPGSTEELLWD